MGTDEQLHPLIAKLMRDLGLVADAEPVRVEVASGKPEPEGEPPGDPPEPDEPETGTADAAEPDELPESASLALVTCSEPPDYVEPPWARYLFHVWDHVADTPMVLLQGPRGTGKTQAAIVYAARRKKRLLICNCNSEMTADSLLGIQRLDLKGRGGDYLQLGPIALAAKYNAVLFMDELNYMPPGGMATLNPITDAVQKGIFLPVTGERIQWSKPRIIAAINDGYAGTRQIPQALLDRAEPIFADYLPEWDEIELIVKRTRCPRELAERAVKTANAIRAAARGDDGQVMPIDFDLSPRALFSFARRVVQGVQSESEAWSEAVLGRIGYSARTAGTRAAVQQLSNQIGGFGV